MIICIRVITLINKYVHVYINQRVNTFVLFLYDFLQQLEFIVDHSQSQSQFTCLNL